MRRLAGTGLSEAPLNEAFAYPTTLALCGDDAFMVSGTANGEVRLRRSGLGSHRAHLT